MERSVIFRDRQETTAEDFNNTQGWLDESQQHLLTDAISAERRYTGLTVTAHSATEIDVAPGRLYHGPTGKVYAHREAQTISVFAQMPLSDQKWLAVSVYGQEEDTDIQNRDFLIDLQTGQTQPQSVAMERRRVANTHIAQGLESPTPEKPEPPTGYTLIAHVRLSPSGIQEIILATSLALPNLQQLSTRADGVDGWINKTEPRIAHIVSDLAGLGEAVAARATLEQALQLAIDLAKIKERLEIPDSYVFYGGDHFLSTAESDTAAGTYSARVVEGIRPVFSGSDTLSLSLLNPIDPDAKVSTDGFLLPAYTEIPRLKLETKTGELTINAYQYQTTQAVQPTMARERLQYGKSRTVSTSSSFWRNGTYDPNTGIFKRTTGETWVVAAADISKTLKNHRQVRLTQVWHSQYEQSYWNNVTTTHTVNGSILAQTLLMAQTGYVTSVELFFTNADPSAGLTLLIADASRGQPDMSRAIAREVFAANALSAGWCKLTLSRPLFVESGRRYAIMLVTGAQHKVGYTDGTAYTQGVLMYAQDGTFFNEAADRDLMMRLNFAQFASPRTVLQMTPLQLVGGIADLDFLTEGITPDGTELHWEYQVAGAWYPVATGTAGNLDTAPALLPLRAVFVGTTDLMPGLRLTQSQVIVSKPGTAFTHFSTTRTLGSNSSSIKVRVLLEDFDAAYHTVGCQLVIGGTPVSPTSSKDQVVNATSKWREYLFTLGSPTSSYVIKLTGSTTDWKKQFTVAERYDLAL